MIFVRFLCIFWLQLVLENLQNGKDTTKEPRAVSLATTKILSVRENCFFFQQGVSLLTNHRVDPGELYPYHGPGTEIIIQGKAMAS
jgi:hypothetical protein